jgi:hypothetical protein
LNVRFARNQKENCIIGLRHTYSETKATDGPQAIFVVRVIADGTIW